MKEISIKSYAKINLSLDITGTLENGFHEIETIYQEVSLYDLIKMRFVDKKDFEIKISCNKDFLPLDNRNLCYKAASLMHDLYKVEGIVYIDIEKMIPVSAGLAGGSSNAASVIIGLNNLWNLNLSLDELMEIGSKIGSDIPFLIYTNVTKKSCALGYNRGEKIIPIDSKFSSYILLVKPKFGVSTKEVYMGMDNIKEYIHPDTKRLTLALEEGNNKEAFNNMINVLENYTLEKYSEVKTVKEKVKKMDGVNFTMMSGSGPTVVGFFKREEDAKKGMLVFRDKGYESFYCKTN